MQPKKRYMKSFYCKLPNIHDINVRLTIIRERITCLTFKEHNATLIVYACMLTWKLNYRVSFGAWREGKNA